MLAESDFMWIFVLFDFHWNSSLALKAFPFTRKISLHLFLSPSLFIICVVHGILIQSILSIWNEIEERIWFSQGGRQTQHEWRRNIENVSRDACFSFYLFSQNKEVRIHQWQWSMSYEYVWGLAAAILSFLLLFFWSFWIEDQMIFEF